MFDSELLVLQILVWNLAVAWCHWPWLLKETSRFLLPAKMLTDGVREGTPPSLCVAGVLVYD